MSRHEHVNLAFNVFVPKCMSCSHYPHPFGNKYHSMCCGKSEVMLNVEMVEGKDRPRALIHLLLWMVKKNFTIGRYVILDSGFFVLRVIVELKKEGVFAGALIKKQHYWLSLVPGEAINKHFQSKDVGDMDVHTGNLSGVV